MGTTTATGDLVEVGTALALPGSPASTMGNGGGSVCMGALSVCGTLLRTLAVR
ncbi:MAG: hypothetical protein M1115_01275 [Actinobacteria bacterium]|nr:hypothetical protein [Actinomycetota bacterium]